MSVYTVNTVIVGSGAAGLNSALRLTDYGQKDIALVTENIMLGTSRNTGSDKQTYFCLTQAGNTPDSVLDMAQSLTDGGCMDGDIALCESALSTQCFYRLVELGVKFPKTRYGEYVSFKTDHDICARGTSSGPYTSRDMTTSLWKEVQRRGILVLDHLQCIRILQNKNKCHGILCIRKDNARAEDRYVAIRCSNVIWATGGPAGMYSDSVYPLGHFGSHGIAFEAGVKGKNLTEWQFGLASVDPRWNVSGTYMQVVPKFVSTKKDGGDEKEFLWDYLSERQIWEKVFLKGYQWPFDVRKLAGGSSLIDILVYIETKEKDRRVFLDYRSNPHNHMPAPDELPECYVKYLGETTALLGTPIKRLESFNQPAVDFFFQHGIDLSKDMLEIALSVQHNNGGLATNLWWESDLIGFFAVGEASGTHGVYRPGGSALNSGQVGSMRAAQYIARCRREDPLELDTFIDLFKPEIAAQIQTGKNSIGSETTVYKMLEAASRRMSKFASIIRNRPGLSECRKKTMHELANFSSLAKVSSPDKLAVFYRLHDILVSQYVYLSAMIDYIDTVGKSRGSALYYSPDGNIDYSFLSETYRHTLESGEFKGQIQEIRLEKPLSCSIKWRPARPIPREQEPFEIVWKRYRQNGNVF